MIYRPAALLAHISRFTTVLPGDVLLTGSPTGSGASRTPPSFLAPGNRVRSIIPGIGMCDNACISDPTA
jgi:acylpyruvate hydrolase